MVVMGLSGRRSFAALDLPAIQRADFAFPERGMVFVLQWREHFISVRAISYDYTFNSPSDMLRKTSD